MKDEETGIKLTGLLEQWNICYNILSKITKDELSLKTKEIEYQLKKHNYSDISAGISELGSVLDKVYNHLQDLGSIYNQMWNVVNDDSSD